MKIKLKKQILTGVAAIALVAPLVLGGTTNDVNADNTSASTPQTTMTAPNTNNQVAQTASSNGQPSANNQPKKTVTMQQLKQMMAKQAAKQKQQLAKEMKGAMDIFVAQGNEVYSAKAKGQKVFPTTMKKYMPLKQYKKVMKAKAKVIQHDAIRYRATHKKKYLRNYQNNIKYLRFGKIPTQKQRAEMQKQQAQQQSKQSKSKQKKSRRSVKKANRKGKLTKKSRRTRKANKRHARKRAKVRKARNVKRSKITTRIKRNRKKAHKKINRKRRNRKTTFTITNTYLKSEYKHGNEKAAKKTGFAEGPTLDQVPTMFDHYKPNSRRAVIPRNYKIIPNDTTWLVGRPTNNVSKINHMKNVYYYNNSYHGWYNIGYKG